jgi:hypothetical protein
METSSSAESRASQLFRAKNAICSAGEGAKGCRLTRQIISMQERLGYHVAFVLKEKGSAENTDSGKSRAGHSSRPSTGALTSSTASGSGRRSIHGGSGDADPITGAGLHAGSRASGDSGGDNRGRGGAGLTSAPGSPRRLSAVASPA